MGRGEGRKEGEAVERQEKDPAIRGGGIRFRRDTFIRCGHGAPQGAWLKGSKGERGRKGPRARGKYLVQGALTPTAMEKFKKGGGKKKMRRVPKGGREKNQIDSGMFYRTRKGNQKKNDWGRTIYSGVTFFGRPACVCGGLFKKPLIGAFGSKHASRRLKEGSAENARD